MTRAILLPVVGNIFIDDYQWKLIKNTIYHTFDEFIVYLNTNFLNESLLEDYKRLYKDNKVKFIEPNNSQVGHLSAIHKLLKYTECDTVCFFESDFFVYDANIIENAFDKIESGEVDYIGEPRGFCTQSTLDLFREYYKYMQFKYDDGTVWNWPSIDKWPNKLLWMCWWPNAFYIKTNIIKNDKYFIEKTLKKGDPIPELDNLILSEDFYYDTFGYAGLILFQNKYKFDIQNQILYQNDSKYELITLRHFLDIDIVANTKLKSIHTCNSSAHLIHNNMNNDNKIDKYFNENILDPNTIKNIAIFNCFLDTYKEQTEFGIIIKNRWNRVLKDIKQEMQNGIKYLKYNSIEYMFTFDMLMDLSDAYKKLLIKPL